ncbi:hypothetical protein BGX38DRAFT_381827 [Terfezia claveryi]|nr:hypothetical protein BGX38DRAFT_381827 [Terfezia claveryi]
MIMRDIGCKKLIIKGLKPTIDMIQKEKELFAAMENQAILILIQVISNPILKVISKFDSPHEIWSHLKDQYYCDTPFSFVYQLRTLFSLASTYTATWDREHVATCVLGSLGTFFFFFLERSGSRLAWQLHTYLRFLLEFLSAEMQLGKGRGGETAARHRKRNLWDPPRYLVTLSWIFYLVVVSICPTLYLLL